MATKSDNKLHKQCHNDYEICDYNKDVQLEKSTIKRVKSEIPLISDTNSAQDALSETIKVEDAANSENYEFEFEKIETVKVEMSVKNEDNLGLEKDPLSEDYETQVKLEVNGELNPQNDLSCSTGKKSKIKVTCKDCNKIFDYNYYHKYHTRIHAPNTLFNCEICGKGFVRQSYLDLHKASHSDDRPYQCNTCGKRFKISIALQRHQYVHFDDVLVQCSECNKCFKRQYLKIHQLRHGIRKQYTCETCGKVYAGQTGLRYHKLSHEISENIACPHCGKLFQGNVRLQKHVRDIHLRKKVHICSYCGKTYSRKNEMMRHIDIQHTGYRPFTCEVCKKSFGRSSELKVHMRSHTGETPYSCKSCAREFKTARQLRTHMKLHSEKE